MGLFAWLGGWKKILRYQIAFDRSTTAVHYTDDPAVVRRVLGDAPPTDDGRWVWIDRTRVSVAVKAPPTMPQQEHIRLWASYHCKVIVNLGVRGAGAAGGALTLATMAAIAQDTDCLARLGWGDALQLVDRIPEAHSVLSGEFYARDDPERMIQTTFPGSVDPFQVMLSSIALLQYCVVTNRDDPESLRVLTATARWLDTYCQARGQQMDFREAFEVPIRAYLAAMGHSH